MPNLGLLGISISDQSFYDAAVDGAEISINLTTNQIMIGEDRVNFQLSRMEKELFDHGGISSTFRKFGNRLFEAMTEPKNLARTASRVEDNAEANAHLQW